MSRRPYTITIDTDNPHVFDLLDEAPGNFEAVMTQHHPVTNAIVDTWHKRGEARGGSLSDPGDVQMEVVETPRPQEDPRGGHARSPLTRDPWAVENPDEGWPGAEP